ncbi:MAG: ribulose-bisphosphate carboxylase large chain [Acidobacteriota bacterium]|nr:ribulose-bisphosphate carboxylase large chain [Acidobacteriota bacterium]
MPDFYEIIYSCKKSYWKRPKNIESLLQDLLYGQTFRILPNREEIVHLTTQSFENHLAGLGESEGRQWFSIKVPRIQLDFAGFTGIMSQLWGNILDYGEFRLEFIDDQWISNYLQSWNSTRRFPQVPARKTPFLATVIKPSYQLSLQERIRLCVEFVKLGGDFIKEDETYFPSFELMVQEVAAIQEALDSLEGSSRGLGLYVPNISGVIHRDPWLAELCSKGMRAAMVNFLITGFQSVQKAASGAVANVFLWGHRVGFKSMQNTLGIFPLIQLSMAAGLNAVHIGTPILRNINQVTKAQKTARDLNALKKRLNIPFFPIFTKTTKYIIPEIVQIFGPSCILAGCGEFITGMNGTADSKKISAWVNAAKQGMEEK